MRVPYFDKRDMKFMMVQLKRNLKIILLHHVFLNFSFLYMCSLFGEYNLVDINEDSVQIQLVLENSAST